MKNIKDNVKNYIKKIGKKRVLSLLVICVLILGLLGGTFAYWNWQTSEAQKTEVAFTLESDFSCAADVGGSIEPGNVPLAPTTCTDTKHAIKRQLIVKPTIFGNVGVYMDLWLDVNSLASELSASQNFRYALTTSDTSCTEGLVSEGTFNGLTTGDKVQMISQKNYSQTLEDTYYLYIWLDAAETNLDTAGKSFNFTINGECGNAEPIQNVILTLSGNGGTMTSQLYGYTKEVGMFTTPSTGKYKLEVWGAQGGTSTRSTNTKCDSADKNSSGKCVGGYGGYSYGDINLTSGEVLYVYVGGKGVADDSGSKAGGYNGGGAGYANYNVGSGGGATHIATTSGLLSSLSSSKDSILIVAGGGGGTGADGSYGTTIVGHAGGFKGRRSEADINDPATVYACRGTQSGCENGTSNSMAKSGSFGKGASSNSSVAGVGAGGGYYGGGVYIYAGGGGSGYIGNGRLIEETRGMVCYRCTESTTESIYTESVTGLSNVCTDDGTTDLVEVVAGKVRSGHGAARISAYEISVNVQKGSSFSTLTIPSRDDGYTFLGWSTSSNATSAEFSSADTINFNSNTTLYAVWASPDT